MIGATQGAGCMGAAYEFLFNVEKWLGQKNKEKVDLYRSHRAFSGALWHREGMPLGETMLKKFMEMFHIHYKTLCRNQRSEKNEGRTELRRKDQHSFTMLMPPFEGVDFIANSPALETGANHLSPVLPTYRHPKLTNVWAAGLTVDVKPPFQQGEGPLPFPKPVT